MIFFLSNSNKPAEIQPIGIQIVFSKNKKRNAVGGRRPSRRKGRFCEQLRGENRKVPGGGVEQRNARHDVRPVIPRPGYAVTPQQGPGGKTRYLLAGGACKPYATHDDYCP